MEDHLEPIELTYQLTTPVRYARDGGMHEGEFLLLGAPSSRHRKWCAPLKQAFMQAILQHSEGRDPEAAEGAKQAEDFSAQEIMAFLAGSAVDYSEVLNAAGQLLCQKGICRVDGEVNMTPALLDELSMDDLEEVVGTYLRGFTLRSALKSLNQS